MFGGRGAPSKLKNILLTCAIIEFVNGGHHNIEKIHWEGARNDMKNGSLHKGLWAVWRPLATWRRVLRTIVFLGLGLLSSLPVLYLLMPV